MTNSIKSTELDFDQIKDYLKQSLRQSGEFNDYDFEGSGLSSILDVLAYNSHLSALKLNFALNESFLNTAQLRSSVVSHAAMLGYSVKSNRAAKAFITINVTIGAGDRPETIAIPRGFKFSSNYAGETYTFFLKESYVGYDDGFGNYTFQNADGDVSIPIYEGSFNTASFFVGEYIDGETFVISDTKIDTSTMTVEVFASPTSSSFISYQNINSVSNIDELSRIYIMNENPNGFYDLSFSDGKTLGRRPSPGEKIVIDYISTNDTISNGASVFVPIDVISLNGNEYSINISTVGNASGGAERESIESIRRAAPVAYSSQNRLVTANDYRAKILEKFPQVENCIAWGGETNIPKKFGVVFVSLNFHENISIETQNDVKNRIKSELVSPLSIMSIDIEFVDMLDVKRFLYIGRNWWIHEANRKLGEAEIIEILE